ncbi:unnamed protein product [Heterobilharzia americana]|nr:unnamed protein product [Heterobilharzia americana]
MELQIIICRNVNQCFQEFFQSFLIRTSNYANEGTQIGRDTNNLHLLNSTYAWKSGLPMMKLTSLTEHQNCVYPNASNINGNVMQTLGRNGYNPGEDDHASAIGTEDVLPVLILILGQDVVE